MVSILTELKVCIVGGDGEMRRMIREALHAVGVQQLRECADPSMALLLLQDFPADLCIIDSAGDGMDRLAFVRKIRAAEESLKPTLPIIMITANAQTQRVIDARQAGVNEFVVRPITARALYSRLLSIVEDPLLFVPKPAEAAPDPRQQDRPVGEQARAEREPSETIAAGGAARSDRKTARQGT